MRQEKAGIRIVVLNNKRLGMVREYQHDHYQNRIPMSVMEGDPDLSLLAQAYDLPYLKIDGKSSLEKELGVFLKQYESGLLEVMIDPEALTPR